MGHNRTPPLPPHRRLRPAHGKICRRHEKAAVRDLSAEFRKSLISCDLATALRWPAGCRRRSGGYVAFRGNRVSSMSSIAPDLPAAVSLTSPSRMQASTPSQDTASPPFAALLDASTSVPPSPPPAAPTQPAGPPQTAQQTSTPTSSSTGNAGNSDSRSSPAPNAPNPVSSDTAADSGAVANNKVDTGATATGTANRMPSPPAA